MENGNRFLYENHICLLKYSKTAIHQNLSFDEKELHILEQLLEQYEYQIGVSNIFTELKRMKDAYAQAVFTLQWNQKTEQNTEVLCQYKDVVMYHLFSRMESEMEPVSMQSEFYRNWPYMTESITLVWQDSTLLPENDCSATRTAAELGIHRIPCEI